MQIVVKPLNGDAETLDVEATDTINNVKAEIQDKARIPIPPNELRLFMGQGVWAEELDNERTLSGYNNRARRQADHGLLFKQKAVEPCLE